MEIAADLGANRLDDLDDEAGAVLERSAVLVLAIVDGRAEELRDQVAVGAVQLHAVEAGLARPARAFGKRRHRLLDVGGRHPLALEAVQRILVVGRAERVLVLDAADVALASRVAQLHDEFTVVLVHRLADGTPERHTLVLVDGGVVRNDASANLHRHERRDDRADTTLGELHFPVDARLVAGTVVVVESAGDVRPEDPILDGEVLELERLEDDVGHVNLARRRYAAEESWSRV